MILQTKMRTFLGVRQTVLDDIVTLDGPGNNQLKSCISCGNVEGRQLYRCLECSYGLLYCRECILKLHTASPLHRLEVGLRLWPRYLNAHYVQCWKDTFFDRTSLYSLGHICYLGHDGNPCPASPPHHQLTIIDANGWHMVQVGFCKCGMSGIPYERYCQLLCMRWYPASFNRPKTAFTFDILETYHKVTLQGKLNLYDFYHAIMHKTDNQGRSKPLVSFLSSREWPLLTGILIVPLSRNLPLCASVEESERCQMWWWCSPGTSPHCDDAQNVRGRMPRLPSSWT